MATSTWKVLVNFSANNLTGGAFASLLSSLRQAHTSTMNLQTAISGLQVAGGVALVDFGKKAVGVFTTAANAAGALQQNLVLMRQAMGNMPQAQMMGNMNALAAQRGQLMFGPNATLYGPQDLSGIQKALLQAGSPTSAITGTYQGHSLGQMLTYVAELEQQRGRGPSEGPTGTASNLAKFLTAYRVGPKDAYGVLNTFQQVQSITGGFNSETMKLVEQYTGQIARAYGVSPQDLTMMAGLFTRAGFGASTIGTGISNMFLYGTDPSKGATSLEFTGRLQAANRMGILSPVDMQKVKASIGRYQAGLQHLGLPADLGSLSKYHQEMFATQQLMHLQSTGMTESLKKGGILGLNDWFNKIYSSELSMAGGDPKAATQSYIRDLQSFMGVRGGREAQAFGNAIGGADGQGGYNWVQRYYEQVTHQSAADILIAQLRDTLQGQKTQTGARSGGIFALLGGVDNKGDAVKGGPLDTTLKFFHALNDVLGKIGAFLTAHPHLAAQMGTAFGVGGVAMLAGGAGLVGIGGLRLAGALLGPGGRAALGGAGHAGFDLIGHLIGVTNPARGVGGLLGRAGSAAGRVGASAWEWSGFPDYFARNLVHPEDAARIAQFGRGAVNNPRWISSAAWDAERFGRTTMGGLAGDIGGGFAKVFEGFKFVAPYLNIAARALPEIGLRFLGVIGWVTLFLDALKFFQQHPKDIAHWIAMAIKLFNETLWPGVKNGVIALVKWLWGYIQQIVQLINPLNWPKNAVDFAKWVKTVTDDVNKELHAKPTTTPSKQQPGAHHPSEEHRQRTRDIVVNNHFNHSPSDADFHRKVAASSYHGLRRALRSSTGGLGTPHLDPAFTGIP